MVWLLVFIVPVLSMGLLAQEWATRNDRNADDRAGRRDRRGDRKVPRVAGLLRRAAGPDAALRRAAADLQPPDLGPIFSGYLGIILVGALFISVGLFCSSLTRSQIVAAVAAVAILFLITIVPWWAVARARLDAQRWLAAGDRSGRLQPLHRFQQGRDRHRARDLLPRRHRRLLFLTIKVLESRRWK